MAMLTLYIPFAESGTGDLRANAKEIAKAIKFPATKNGNSIDGVVVAFLEEERDKAINAGDVLVVHAHGGKSDTILCDNQGAQIAQDELMARLRLLNAFKASEAYFFLCYSGLKNHIAPVFKRQAEGCEVYGIDSVAEGALVQMTRQGTCKNAIWSADSGQLQEIELA